MHAELEHSASRAQARGGLAAAAAFLERATLLTREATARGEGIAMAVTAHSEALLYNGLGRYEHAVTAAQRATNFNGDLGTSSWALVELIEAATRSGMAETAVGALLSDGPSAEILYPDRIPAAPGSHRCGRGHALDTGGEDLR